MRIHSSLPRYRKHKATNQAVVTLSGKDFYLGPHGTKTSKNEYDRLIGEWLANGRRIATPEDSITIVELVAAYVRWAKSYYRKNGQLTDTVTSIKNAVRPLVALYGRTAANEFGPLKLQSVIANMVDLDWSRIYVNDCQSVIKRMFKWGASQQLVSADVFHALQTVCGLRKGRTTARESKPVLPVEDAIVNATLERLPDVVADMVRLQLATGMRPAEVCIMRPCDIDTSGDVWLYRPESHKTEHHGHSRIVAIGPQGQDVLRKYLVRGADDYCFDPRDSEKKRRRLQHDRRVVPIGHGNSPGSNRKRKPKWQPGNRYSSDSYRRAIQRAAAAAKVSSWSPNQLRHSAATKIRSQFGLESAQVVLGHTNANITQVYAERDLQKAIDVARQVG